jgi:hypothetical protein
MEFKLWRNPKKQTKKLVEFIKSIEKSNPSIFGDKSKTGLAFTDNIMIIENELSKLSPNLNADLKVPVEAVTKKENTQTELFKGTITVIVKLK